MLSLATSCRIAVCTLAVLIGHPGLAQTGSELESLAQKEGKGASPLILATSVAGSRADTVDIISQRLDLELDPSRQYIKGSVSFRYLAKGPVGRLYFDMANTLRVDSIVQGGRRLVSDRSETDLLKISLASPLQTGALARVTIYYQGAPDPTQGSFVTQVRAGVPILWTLSEPYGAHEWWPCKQNLSDKADTTDMYVTAPNGNKVAGNGLLQSVSAVGATRQRWHWRHTYPIPNYLVSTAITAYRERTYKFRLRTDSLLYQNYFFADYDNSPNYELIDRLPRIMQLFDSLFGPYPYGREKYGHAQFAWGGGMEHSTMSSMADFNTPLVAHELAHQWFGNKITCGSWQDIWLNEGFATYLEGLSRQFGANPESWQLWKANTIANIIRFPAGSVFVNDTTSVGRIFNGRLSYAKGAMLLHMLRYRMGDQAFFSALQAYQADPAVAYGFARTSQLQGHLERAYGQPLQEFFNDWFYGQGYPAFSISYNQFSADSVRVIVNQSSSDPSVSFFDTPITLRLVYPGGAYDDVRIDLARNGQTFTLPTRRSLARIQPDPDQWVLGTYSVSGVNALPLALASSLKLSPQPAQEAFSIEGLPTQGAPYTLLDLSGKVLAQGTARVGIPIQAQLASGSYLVMVHLATGRAPLRLVIER